MCSDGGSPPGLLLVDEASTEEEEESEHETSEDYGVAHHVNGHSNTPQHSAMVQRLLTKARTELNNLRFDASYCWYCTALALAPGLHVNEEFFTATNCMYRLLRDSDRVSDAFDCLQNAASLDPNNAQILELLGQCLIESSRPEKAFEHLWRALHLARDVPPDFVSRVSQTLKSVFFDVWHFHMLNDGGRNLAYKLAIEQVGGGRIESAVDLGCGTGLLSAYCLDAGISRVLAVDQSQVMCAVARDLLQSHERGDRRRATVSCLPIQQLSPTHMSDAGGGGGRVNLVVTEIFDCALFGEGCLPLLKCAWDNVLEHNSHTFGRRRVIPGSASVYAVAAQCPHLRTAYSVRPGASSSNSKLVKPNILFGRPGSATYDNIHLGNNPSAVTVLSDPVRLHRVDFNDGCTYSNIDAICALKLEALTLKEEGVVDLIVVYFELHLAGDVMLSTWLEKVNCWGQAVFPSHLPTTCALPAGTVLTLETTVLHQTDLSVVIKQVDGSPVPRPVDTDDAIWTENCALIAAANDELNEILVDASALHVQGEQAVLVFVGQNPLLPVTVLLNGGAFSKAYVVLSEHCDRALFRSVIRQSLVSNSISCARLELVAGGVSEVCGMVSLVLVDMSDGRGRLSAESVQFVALALRRFPGCRVLPNEIVVYGQLVESSHIASNCAVLDDDNLHGVSLQHRMHIFQQSLFLDMDVQFVPLQPLSARVQLARMSLHDLAAAAGPFDLTHDFTVTTDGCLHAMLYSFEFVLQLGAAAAAAPVTYSPRRIAAVVFPSKHATVIAGEDVHLNLVLSNGAVMFS